MFDKITDLWYTRVSTSSERGIITKSALWLTTNPVDYCGLLRKRSFKKISREKFLKTYDCINVGYQTRSSSRASPPSRPRSSRSNWLRALNTKLSCPFAGSSVAVGVPCFWGFRCFCSTTAWGCWSRWRVMPVRRWPTRRQCSASATFRTCRSRQSTTTKKTRMCSRLLSAALRCCYCCWWSSKAFGCSAPGTSDTVSVVALLLGPLQMKPKLEITQISQNSARSKASKVVSPLIRLFWSLVPMTVLLYRWLTRFDGVLICGKIVNGVIGWDRWYFCNSCCCWVWSFSFNWSRLCFISDVAEFDEVMMNVADDDDELPGTSQSWWTASSGVIRFLGSHLEKIWQS